MLVEPPVAGRSRPRVLVCCPTPRVLVQLVQVMRQGSLVVEELRVDGPRMVLVPHGVAPQQGRPELGHHVDKEYLRAPCLPRPRSSRPHPGLLRPSVGLRGGENQRSSRRMRKIQIGRVQLDAICPGCRRNGAPRPERGAEFPHLVRTFDPDIFPLLIRCPAPF